MNTNQKGFSVVETLIVIIVVGLIGGAGWYVWQSKNKKPDSANTSQTTQTQQVTPEKAVEVTNTYQSKLYPSLSFIVPSGWQVNEPAKYDEKIWGAGSADSEIKITKGETTLSLTFSTLKATGFAGNMCYNYKDLVKVQNLYRFTNKKGATSYQPGVSASDKDWVNASTGEYPNSVDPNPNYCVSFPFIATHKSTLNKKDYPESPFNGVSTDVNEVLAWVSAEIKGNVAAEVLVDTDKIVSSISKSVIW